MPAFGLMSEKMLATFAGLSLAYVAVVLLGWRHDASLKRGSLPRIGD